MPESLLELRGVKHPLSTNIAIVGWMVSPRRYVYLKPQNVTLFGIRFFADIIKGAGGPQDKIILD